MVIGLMGHRLAYIGLTVGVLGFVLVMIWTEWPYPPDVEDAYEWAGAEVLWFAVGAALHCTETALRWHFGRNGMWKR